MLLVMHGINCPLGVTMIVKSPCSGESLICLRIMCMRCLTCMSCCTKYLDLGMSCSLHPSALSTMTGTLSLFSSALSALTMSAFLSSTGRSR